MKKGEKLLIILLLIISLTIFVINKIRTSNSTIVTVKDNNGNILLSFDLNEDNYYEINGKVGKFHIEVKDHKCRAIDVDCPNQICVNTGWISVDNPVPIICLPNGIVVSIDE